MKKETGWVAMRADEQPRKVEGYIVDHFIIHKGLGSYGDSVNTWALHHIPTGMRAYGGLKTRKLAVELATAFNSVPGIEKGKWAKAEYLTDKVLGPMRDILESFKKKHKLERYQWSS